MCNEIMKPYPFELDLSDSEMEFMESAYNELWTDDKVEKLISPKLYENVIKTKKILKNKNKNGWNQESILDLMLYSKKLGEELIKKLDKIISEMVLVNAIDSIYDSGTTLDENLKKNKNLNKYSKLLKKDFGFMLKIETINGNRTYTKVFA